MASVSFVNLRTPLISFWKWLIMYYIGFCGQIEEKFAMFYAAIMRSQWKNGKNLSCEIKDTSNEVHCFLCLLYWKLRTDWALWGVYSINCEDAIALLYPWTTSVKMMYQTPTSTPCITYNRVVAAILRVERASINTLYFLQYTSHEFRAAAIDDRFRI